VFIVLGLTIPHRCSPYGGGGATENENENAGPGKFLTKSAGLENAQVHGNHLVFSSTEI